MVRADLPIGLLCAQVTHAAGFSSPGNLPEHTYAVVLAAQGAEELREVAGRLDQAGLAYVCVVESEGRYAGHLMALGVKPGPKRVVGRPLGSLPLLSVGNQRDCQRLIAECEGWRDEAIQAEEQLQRRSWWRRLKELLVVR